MATQVDVDQACLELNDRSRHPINHFMSCPLDDIQRSRLEVASKIGLSSRRLVRSAAAECADLPQRQITVTRDPTDQRCKNAPAPSHRYRCRYLSKVYAPRGTRGCVKWKTLGLRIYLPIPMPMPPIMSPIAPPLMPPPPVPLMSPLASVS